MKTEIGEYIVGAYLKIEKQCDVVDYNVRHPGGGMEGLEELDVIGLNFEENTAYICEVATHIRGLVYGKSTTETFKKVLIKHEKQKEYAKKYLKGFKPHFMFWSPYVPEGNITNELSSHKTLELIINKQYAEIIKSLIKWVAVNTHDTGNYFLRTLQILTHLKGLDLFAIED